jgi:DNA-binding NtrC family response regulator
MMPKRGRILVADDEPTMRALFQETLAQEWEVKLAEDGSRAKALLDHESFDIVFLDLRMPGRDGAELFRWLRERGRAPKTVLMSAHAGAQLKAELLQEGCDRFLEKPIHPDVLCDVARVLRGEEESAPRAFVAFAPCMKRILEVIEGVSSSRATVLLQGETGTGKELLARELHRRSARAQKSFVRVNCAALAEGVLESELFGHERGSFTGAVRTTAGLFQMASGGTLLLDEVSEVSPALQAKLLRVLQEREVRRVGGAEMVPVDVRVIATTNRDLRREVSRGAFRADLYHRLNVVRIDVPPLRERREDIAEMARGILSRKALEHEITRPVLEEEALEILCAHSWPGNVRELENVLERSLLLQQGGRIRATDLALDPPTWGDGDLSWDGRTLAEIERSAIRGALSRCRGNRTHAARALGVSVRTIRNKIRELKSAGISVDEEKK